MQDALGIVIFVVVGVGAVIAVVSLFGRSRLYDDIGRGGLSIGEDSPPPRSPGGSRADREAEIRQLLDARNARRAARGEAPVDVDAELAALVTPAADPELEAEVRAVVEARNTRRIARGEAPLDVEAEIARRLREM